MKASMSRSTARPHTATATSILPKGFFTKRAVRKRAARFRLPMFAVRIRMGGMKRQMLRLSLAVLVVATTALAAMVWSAKFDGDPDPKARFFIEGVRMERDRSFHWLEIHLKRSGDKAHDMRQPVRLVTADGTEHEPADTTFAGSPEKGFTDIWFKFWLEDKDLDGTIDLRLNGGELRVKTNQGLPATDTDGKAVLKSADWGKSWLGF